MFFSYITNAFSLNMIENRLISRVRFREFDIDQQEMTAYKSVVGHADIASIMSKQLGVEVPFNRQTLKIDDGNVNVLIGQYKGPRLEEGATQLPEGSVIEYYEMYFEPVVKLVKYQDCLALVNIATGESVKTYDPSDFDCSELAETEHQLNK